MHQLLGIFAVWLVWTLVEPWVTAPRYAWLIGAALLGVGWELLDGDTNLWWVGIGIGGGAAVLVQVTDLLLVATDSAKVNVLRRNR